ncbi:hypothetical protein SDC9_51414 [bioreactor metagenome]|uniref:Uncharacterized protein n=1 Tax=bioreactor metagenome TaxID=1076179 RepID=A0A644WNU4_9ZZZZ
MSSSNIVSWMKKFNFNKLLMWLQATAIHPNNQLYQMRFEYLIACLLTIKEMDFENNPLTYLEFKKRILTFFNATSKEFYITEDFQPYSQLKLIPYFYNGHKYYFFYGNLERPWEFINKLDYMYLKPQYQITEHFEDTYLWSLTFQTNLLRNLVSDTESSKISKGLYIPSEQYLNKFGLSLTCKENAISSALSHITPGEFSLHLIDANKTTIYEAFDALLISSSDKIIYLLPQLHIEVLFKILSKFVFESQHSKENLKKANQIIKTEFLKHSAAFFGKDSILHLIDIQKESLLRENEVAIRIAEDQILLFHILRVRHNTAFHMESAISIVKNRIKDIKSQSLLGLETAYEAPSLIPSEVLNLQGIILFQYTGISAMPIGINDLSIPVFSYDDIIRIFELLNTPVEFLNYINEHINLHQKARVILTDQLDEFAAYITNGKSFLEAGKYPNLFHFESHSWHDYYSGYLFEKYSRCIEIFEFVESFKPYYFDYVSKVSSNVYEVFNKADLLGGTVILLNNKAYFISSVIIRNNNDLKISEKFLKPLFCEYLVKLNNALDDLIFVHLSDIMPDIIYIDLLPCSAIEREPFIFLKEEVIAINSNNPVHITVRWRKAGEPHIFVLFDSENMTVLFSDEMNGGERITIHQLIIALLKYFINDAGSDVDIIADEFINANMPVDRRRFGVEAVATKNPRLVDYKPYIETTETNLSIMRRQVAEYIAISNYEPDQYPGMKAKEIIEATYRMLQEKLESTLLTFNTYLIQYAYKQLEYVEGKKENNRRKAEIDKRTHTDFDVVSSYTERSNDISLYTLAIKHIITSALKIHPTGSKSITSIEWRNILAIAHLIIEVTQTYDFSEYNLTELSVTISDLYEIQQSTHDDVFDSQKYAYEVNQNLLSEQEDKVDLPNEDETRKIIDDAFNTAYGFTFQEMLTILSALGVNDFEHTSDYPINVMERDKLCNQLHDWYQELNLNTIHQIIDFLSLTLTTYGPGSNLIPSFLMRKKERLNLCPLLSVEKNIIWGNQMCISSSRFWSSTVSDGDFPYSIDCPKIIIKAMKVIHRKRDKELEIKLAEIARKTVGCDYVISPLLKFDSIHDDLPRYPDCGEIDLLAVLPTVKKIIVGEAKNRNKRSRAYDMQLEHRDFFDEETGYYTKLKKKAEFVRNNLQLFLKHFGIIDEDGWTVESVFLVNRVYSAAFLGHDVNFILKGNFHQYLLDELNKKIID